MPCIPSLKRTTDSASSAPSPRSVEVLKEVAKLGGGVRVAEELTDVKASGAVRAEGERVEPPLPKRLSRASLRGDEGTHPGEPHGEVLGREKVGGGQGGRVW